MAKHRPRARAWGVSLLIVSVLVFLGFERLEEPDATSLELLRELVDVGIMALVSAGVFLILGSPGGNS